MAEPETFGEPTMPAGSAGRTDAPESTAADSSPPTAPGVVGETVVLGASSGTLGGESTESPASPGASGGPARGLAGYELLGELGRGGMGVVYRARQVRLNRPCALKMILAGDHAGPEAVARFVAEAETVARLRHPGFVQIYSIGDHDGRTFIELELVEGGSLADRLDGTPWPPRRAAELVATLAGAMAEAHRLGIVHRDLKPANVLLAADGSPKVADFGLAKSLDSGAGLTRTESVLGTPSYMAPEQAHGRARDLGPPADVYSLGAILYELLTGRPPFRGASVLQTLEQVKSAEPVPPSRLVPGLPRDVETACLKCLQKDPARRYADASALADDLGRFLAGEPIRARPVGPAERMARWVRKRPAVSALIALVVVVGALGFAGVVWQWDRARVQRDYALEQRARAERQRERAERFARRADQERDRADRQLYATSAALAHREWLANDAGRALALLDQAPPHLRGWEWGYLKGLCQAERLTLRGHRAAVTQVASRGDGRLVTAARDGEVRVWDGPTGGLLDVRDLRRPCVALGPDGRRYAALDAGDESSVRIRDLDATPDAPGLALRGHEGPLLHPMLGEFSYPVAFGEDGRSVVTGGRDRTVRVWDLAEGKARAVLRGHRGPVTAVAISPDGSKAASASGGRFEMAGGGRSTPEDAEVVLWDVATGAPVRRLEGEEIGLTRLVFSPDGRRLAGASLGESVRVWDVDGGAPATLRGHRSFLTSVAFSPDGRQVVSTSLDQSARVWDAAGGRELIALRGHAAQVFDAAFLDDGRRLVTTGSDGAAKVWDLAELAPAPAAPDANAPAPSLEYRAFSGRGFPTQAIDFSPDGTRLAAGDWEGRIRVWDLARGREILSFPAHVQAVSTVHFSPDGRKLVSAGGGLYGTRPGQARVWDAATGRQLAAYDGGAGGPVGEARFSPDGRRIALVVGNGIRPRPGRLKVVDDRSGREVLARDLPGASGALAWSPDGTSLAVGRGDGGVDLLDAGTGETLRSYGDRSVVLRALAFRPDGRQLAATGDAPEGRACPVVFWDVATGREVRRLPGHPQTAHGLAFSPDGRRVASASADATLKLWDVEQGLELLTLRQHTHEVYAVAFSRGGRLLASSGQDGTVLVRGLPPSPPVDTDDWPVVFADDFERPEPSGRWDLRNGRWSIEGGSLRGELHPEPSSRGAFRTALAVPRMAPLPSVAEVRLECRAPRPINLEVKLHDDEASQGLVGQLLGVPNPSTYPGEHAALVLAQVEGRYGTVAADARFLLRPDTIYRVRVLRFHGTLTVTVDGAEVVSAPVPDLDVPVLHLQGIVPADAREGRQIVLDNIEVRVPAAVRAEARALDLVRPLFASLATRDEVLARVRDDPSLDAVVRALALGIAGRRAETWQTLNAAAWWTVRSPGRRPEEYALALRRAEAACRLAPDNAEALNTLGVAQYRAGRPADALATLSRADAAHAKGPRGAEPTDVGFLALAHHRLGHRGEARAQLDRLRTLVADPAWEDDQGARATLREAETVLGE